LFLGEALEKRYDRFHKPDDLDAAITARQRSLSLTEADNADRNERAYHLGKLLLTREDRSGHLADLDAAVDALQIACSAQGDGRDRGTWCHALGALLRRYNRMYRPADLEAAIRACRTTFERAPDGTAHKLAYLLATAHALQQRFALLGDASDCDTTIDMIQRAVSGQHRIEIPAEQRGAVLFGLGLALKERYLAVGDTEDLVGAATGFRRAASRFSAGDPLRQRALSLLGQALSALYRSTAHETHRAEAIRAFAAIVESPRTDPGLHDQASAGCARLQRRMDDAPLPAPFVRREELAHEAAHSRGEYRSGRELSDLNRAITFTRLLLPPASSADASHVSHLVQLAEDLLERYERTDWPADAGQALTVAKRAVESARDPRALSAALCTAANAWLAYHRVTSDLAALENDIAAATRSVEAAPADEPGRPWCHNVLGNSLMRRYEEFSDIADARRGADELRHALTLIQPDSAHRRLLLNNLGAALRSIFDHERDVDALNEAINSLRAASADGEPSVTELANLGNAYMTRYDLTTDAADADRALQAYQQALEDLPPSDRRYPIAARGLFEAVISEPGRDPNTIQQAAECVVNVIENHAPSEGVWHHRLGGLLREAFQNSGDMHDLQRAVEACWRAAELTPPEHPQRLRVLTSLAYSLRVRYERTHEAQDLDEAEALARQCITAVPGQSSLTPALKVFLKLILELRLQDEPDTAVRTEVLRLACEISASTAAPPLVRALQARDAAVIYAGADNWRAAAEQYELAVSLLPFTAPGHDLREGIRVLRPGRVAADGAACWLNAGEPERAVVLAELGRAVFISWTTTGRAGLRQLRAQRPDLAGKFELLRSQLDRPGPAGVPLAELWDEAGPLVDRAATAAEMESLLTTIRSLPGHERFLIPLRIEDLLAAAEEGWLILLNTSNYRCDALVLSTQGVRTVRLGGVTVEDIVRRATYVQVAGARADNAETTSDVLVWLWDKVVEPILQEIGIMTHPGTERWPRIWWIPDGAFAWLPIHAAGRHGEPHTSGAPTLMDRAQSSYIPAVGMLVHARARAREVMKPGKVLVVAMPKTPGQIDLAGVLDEADAIADLFPTTVLGTIPGAHGPATREAITNEVLTHTVSHFSCHAHGDWADPWRSFLAIQGNQSRRPDVAGALDLTDITSLDLKGQRLACLSACATTRPTEVRLLDEAIHLSSGFLMAGFTHVSGTLWEVEDRVAAEFTREMYSRLEASPALADPNRAALAVHEATRAVRKEHIETPVRWASYIYVGC